MKNFTVNSESKKNTGHDLHFYYTISFHSVTLSIFHMETQEFVVIKLNKWLEIVINIITYFYCSDSEVVFCLNEVQCNENTHISACIFIVKIIIHGVVQEHVSMPTLSNHSLWKLYQPT